MRIALSLFEGQSNITLSPLLLVCHWHRLLSFAVTFSLTACCGPPTIYLTVHYSMTCADNATDGIHKSELLDFLRLANSHERRSRQVTGNMTSLWEKHEKHWKR